MNLNCSSYVAPLSRHDAHCYSGPWKMLMTSYVIFLNSQHLFDCSIRPKLCIFIACIYAFAWMLSPTWTPLHHLFVSLPLSCFPPPYLFLLPPPPLPLDSISPDNEGMIQLSLARCLDQGASVFLSTVCEWCLIRVPQMLLKQECWCTLVSVHFEIRKSPRADE